MTDEAPPLLYFKRHPTLIRYGKQGWQLYQDGWMMEHEYPLFVIGNQFCVDAFGAYDFKRGDLDTKLKVWKQNCVYPLKGSWTDEDGPFPYDEDEEDELRRRFQANEVLPFVLERLNEVDRRVLWPRRGRRYAVRSFHVPTA